MASKLAKAAMMGPVQHTAGLYSDMSVDGPEIGTLVCIVDRARNLPNRKTMGKQDAYCAARLGKEAKKTETDRRGGQTPKWDQELRFVVRDALDYQQLKVSVFSEDKRTDLVGECWIPLDAILTPGGGKNDLWHSLNYKGKQAGEIRVELTFYDSRPREAKEPPPMRGEREATKQVKRRPLPADPTGTTPQPVSWHGPRPLPSTTPGGSPAGSTRSHELIQPRQEFENYQQSIPPQNNDYQYDSRSRSDLGYASQSDLGMSSRSDLGMAPRSDRAYNNYLPPTPDEQEDEVNWNYNGSAVSAPATYGGIELPELPPHTPRSHRSSNPITPKYYTPHNSSPQYTLPQYERTPEAQSPLARERAGSYRDDPYRSSPLRAQSMDDASQRFQQSPHDSQQRHNSANAAVLYNDQDLDDAAPPPPPRHSRGPSIQGQNKPGYSPAPLNIRRPGSSNAASPLVREYHPQDEQYGISPIDNRMVSTNAVSAPVTANHTPTTQRFNQHNEHRRSVQPDYNNSYEDMSNGLNRRPQSYASPAHSPHHAYNHNDPYRRGHQSSGSFDSGHSFVQDRHSGSYLDQGISPQRYAHREGAPVAAPRAISPGRVIPRKSVSPRPSMQVDESPLRQDFPSGPEAFDVFNPLTSSNPASQFATPDGTPTKGLNTERIIGTDGKEIDPSDHLPLDTWAPEPEKKSPRKSHQINVKFRHIPQGSQSRSQSTTPSRPLPQVSSRPTSMMSSPTQPTYTQYQQYSAEDSNPNSPQSAGRNRLHKRPPAHLQSSSNNHSPQQSRISPSSQPLRELANYGYNNNSPLQNRHSMAR